MSRSGIRNAANKLTKEEVKIKENEENKYPVHSIRIVPVRFL